MRLKHRKAEKEIISLALLLKQKDQLAQAVKECRAHPNRTTAAMVCMASRDIFLEFVALSFLLGAKLPSQLASVPKNLTAAINVVADAAQTPEDKKDKVILARYARNEAVRLVMAKTVLKRDWDGLVHFCTSRIAWSAASQNQS